MRQKTPRYVFSFSILVTLILWSSSCRKDFNYEDSFGNLSFSKDTVFLDTVFTNISSSTYTLKVYNKSNKDLKIPSIVLNGGIESNYRLNVDGQAGEEFYDVPLMAKDSLFIFIETTFDISTTAQNQFLYTDAILFDTGINQQAIPLITLIKDAIFLYPKKDANGISESIVLEYNNDILSVNGFLLTDDQLTFTNEKPYVIYGYAVIPADKTLKMDAGARVYFHKNSGIYTQDNSTLEVNGSLSMDQVLLENQVIFEGDRLEPEFSSIAGQWGTIYLSKESINNNINYLTIKNATIGLLVNGTNSVSNTNLTITNSQLYNNSSYNLWCKSSTVVANNLILGNAGSSSLYCNNGGKYIFSHATIANYWTSSFRSGSAVQIDSGLSGDANLLVQADFANCIIDGNNSTELILLNSNSADSFRYSFTNCMLKINSTFANGNSLYNFDDTSQYNSIFLNENSGFVAPNANDFQIESTSFAIGTANLDMALQVPVDILGRDRTINPDIGGYQFFE